MTRFTLVTLALFGFLSPASGQDMPLAEIIKPGEEWTPVDDSRRFTGIRYVAKSERRGLTFTNHVRFSEVTVDLPDGKRQILNLPLEKPTGLALIHNDSTLVVADAASNYLWAFRVKNDGSLDAGEKYYTLRVRQGEASVKTTQLTADTKDRIYAATSEGIQIFDPTGRMCGVLMVPVKEPITDLFFTGDRKSELLLQTETKGFRRKMLANEPVAPKKK